MARRKAPPGPPPRWFVNISPHEMLWKHDTPEQRSIPPNELIDLSHFTEGQVVLFLRLEYVRAATDAEIAAHTRRHRS